MNADKIDIQNEKQSWGLARNQVTINTLKKLSERLELRLYLSGCGKSEKNDYDKNEIEILKIETISRIGKLKRTIDNLEMEFKAKFLHLCGRENSMK